MWLQGKALPGSFDRRLECQWGLTCEPLPGPGPLNTAGYGYCYPAPPFHMRCGKGCIAAAATVGVAAGLLLLCGAFFVGRHRGATQVARCARDQLVEGYLVL